MLLLPHLSITCIPEVHPYDCAIPVPAESILTVCPLKHNDGVFTKIPQILPVVDFKGGFYIIDSFRRSESVFIINESPAVSYDKRIKKQLSTNVSCNKPPRSKQRVSAPGFFLLNAAGYKKH